MMSLREAGTILGQRQNTACMLFNSPLWQNYRGIMSLSWSDIELSWKLHLPEHLWIFTYINGNVFTILYNKSFCLSLSSPVRNLFFLHQEYLFEVSL